MIPCVNRVAAFLSTRETVCLQTACKAYSAAGALMWHEKWVTMSHRARSDSREWVERSVCSRRPLIQTTPTPTCLDKKKVRALEHLQLIEQELNIV